LCSSHATIESIGTTLPGATDSACAATASRDGTRCTMALTVVSTISGLSLPVSRDSFASVVRRCARMPPCGDTRS
jgi:hypothetical protein